MEENLCKNRSDIWETHSEQNDAIEFWLRMKNLYSNLAEQMRIVLNAAI